MGRPATGSRPKSWLGRRRPASSAASARVAPNSIRRSLVIGSVALLLAILLGPTLKNYLDQRGQIAALQDRVAAQEADVAVLEHEKSLWANPEYVEQQARKRLKFVHVGEKAYSIIDAEPAAADAARAKAADDSNHPWYGQLWESAKLADNPQRADGR